MRKFSSQEQCFIRKLVENSKNLESNFPINILDSLFQEKKVKVEFCNSRGCVFIFWRPTENIGIEEINDILEVFLEFSFLLQYLMKNGLIYKLMLKKIKKRRITT